MADRNGSSGHLTIALIIAIIVGLVVYFLVDSKPVVAPSTDTVQTGDVITSGETTDTVTTGE